MGIIHHNPSEIESEPRDQFGVRKDGPFKNPLFWRISLADPIQYNTINTCQVSCYVLGEWLFSMDFHHRQ